MQGARCKVQGASALCKVKSASSQVAHTAGAYRGFSCSIKRLRVLLLPRGWDVSPAQDYPSTLFRWYLIIHLDGE